MRANLPCSQEEELDGELDMSDGAFTGLKPIPMRELLDPEE